MRVTVVLLVSLLWGTGAAAGEGIYDKDPDHLWNRVHEAIMVRTDGRGVYGRDNSVPFLEDGQDLLEGAAHTNVMAVLDEFVRTKGETRGPKQGGLAARALLQHDLWAAFDVATQANPAELEPARRALRGRLARVIARLAVTNQEWSELPDNYEEAVRGGGAGGSGAFAKDYDPEHPERAFLPADLFDEKGPWVQVGDRFRLAAPAHVSALSGRSAFLVFIRCPGKRDETLAYLEKLNLQ